LEDSLRASVQGLELVDQARKRKGWNRQSAAWAQAALTSVASLKQFWRRERISRETFTRICQTVGLDNWQEIADHQPVQQIVADWGEAPEPAFFCGRIQELETLDHWLTVDRCKLVALLGMGGMGKTTLAVKLVQQVLAQREGGGEIGNESFNSSSIPRPSSFQFVIWRSLRNAPLPEIVLTDLMRFFSGPQQQLELTAGTQGFLPLLAELIVHLRDHRCLVVLDNAESILVSDDSQAVGNYRAGYEGYGELLRRVGEERHQSCLMLTSREQPREIALLEGEKVRSLRLRGLPQKEGQKILERIGSFSTSAAECDVIVDHYAGNPLALKLAAAGIRDLLHGNVSEFLSLLQQGTLVFSDIRDLLERHFNRLSGLEQEVLYWLAIAREPISIEELKTDMLSPESRLNLTATLDALKRRSLLEVVPTGFTLQPAVMEYVTNRLVKSVLEEILLNRQVSAVAEAAQHTGEAEPPRPQDPGNSPSPTPHPPSPIPHPPSPIPHPLSPIPHLSLKNHALIKATAKDYIREAQTRLILEPLIEQLQIAFDSAQDIKAALMQLIPPLQGKPAIKTGYIGGNILNLLCYLQVDLTGFDFSHLTLWQADLRRAILHRINFANSDLSQSAFTETFGNVLSVAFSPDGKTLVKSDEQGWISLWQVETGKQLLSFRAHSYWVFSVAFSPDGKTLASGGLDRTVKLWDLNTGRCLQTFQIHDGGVSAVAYAVGSGYLSNPSPLAEGKNILASSSADQTIKLINLQTGDCQTVLTGHQGIVRSIAFSPNAQILASASLDQTIKLWNINTGACLKTLEDTTAIYAVAFVKVLEAGDGHAGTGRNGDIEDTTQNSNPEIQTLDFSSSLPAFLLASAGDDGTVKLWDTATGECVQVLKGHSDRVWSLAASLTGEILISSSDDRAIKIWDINTGKCLKTLQGHQNRIWSVALSPDGQTLASGSNDRTLRLWNISNGQCLRVLQGYDNCTSPIAFLSPPAPLSPSLSTGSPPTLSPSLLTFSADQSVRLWDLQTNQCLKTILLPTKAAMQAALSPDGSTVAGGSLDHTIRLCDVNSGTCLRTLHGHTAWVRTVAFSPDGTLLASASGDQTIKLWNIHTGKCLFTLIGHTNPIQSIAFSPNGELLASGSWDWTIKLWEINSGTCLNTLTGHTDQLREVEFSLDGQLLVSSSLDRGIRLWEIATGKCLKILDAHTAGVEAIACSPDGQLLASASQDGTIRLWRLPTGECLHILSVQTGYSGALVFSSDSQVLAIGGEDGICTLWDIHAIRHLQTLQVPRPYEGMNITEIKGLTDAQKASLCALGAFVE
jgi:WD40 repeat protein